MGATEFCAKGLLLIWVLCCIVFIPLAFGVGLGTIDLFDDADFNDCISLLNMNTTKPSNTELNVLIACGVIAAALFCCSCFVAKVSEFLIYIRYQVMGCLWLLDAITGSALFMHIFTYLNEINADGGCPTVTSFYDSYNWSEAGVVVGSLIVSLTCCVICFFAMAIAAEESDKKQQSGTRTVAVRNNNNNNNNPRGRLLGQGQQPTITASQQRYVGGLLSLAVVEQCGFVIATDNNRRFVLNRLNNVSPLGQTALRDAVIYGIQKMLALKVVIAKLGIIEHKFIHIVLTDGMDNRSQCTLTDTQSIFMQLGREIGDICTTFFIGIGLGYQERAQLQSIADLAGDAAELFNCQDVQLSDVFDRIKIRVGIDRNVSVITDGTNFLAAQQDQLYIRAEREKFLVLFTLDKSGSMSGGRWRRVCGAVNGFCQGMGQHDIIGCILFNENVVCITDR